MTIDEIGWMVLPERQGRGLASAGVAEALRRADETARWRLLHAFPATTNAPSNALCRKHGFSLRGPIDYTCVGAAAGLLACFNARTTVLVTAAERMSREPAPSPASEGAACRCCR